MHICTCTRTCKYNEKETLYACIALKISKVSLLAHNFQNKIRMQIIVSVSWIPLETKPF